MIKSYPSTYIYMMLIFLSIIMIISSNNWFFTWMGFELSLFGFLPLFITTTKTTESITKYFLMQTSGSAMFLSSFLISTTFSKDLILLGMLMKMGLFPFIQWMPIVMASLSWTGCLVLATIQKMGPLMVIIMINPTPLMILFSVLSVLISSILGFNQTIMRPLMAYSSISHSSWIVLIAPVNMKLFMLYILIYFSTTIYLFMSFEKSGTEKTNQSSQKETNNFNQNLCLLALTGIPPFAIFILKLNVFYIYLHNPIMVMTLLLSTFISTYYYLSFIIPKLTNSWNKITKTPLMIILINLTPTILLI